MIDLETEPLSAFRDRLTALRVREDATLDRVVAMVLDHPGVRDVCVVDEADHLLGVIRVERLFRALFFHHADPNLMTRHLIDLTSSERAGHLMVPPPGLARDSDLLGDAIRTMVQRGLAELPVVDAESRLLGSVSVRLILSVWLDRRAGP